MRCCGTRCGAGRENHAAYTVVSATNIDNTRDGYWVRLYHRLGSPPWFYAIAGQLVPWLAALAVVLLVVGTAWGLAWAPADYQQGDSFRIMYVHVPTAFLAESCYMMLGVAGLILLVWRMKLADMFIASAAPIGAALTALALISGTIWGMPTWGISARHLGWVWDARVMSMLVLLFLYFGIIALRAAIPNETTAGRAAALLAVVGVINIPIIKYSVDWWLTLHQGASFTLTRKPAMPMSMWMPLLLNILGFYAAFLVSVLLALRAEILSRERSTRWVAELVAQR